LAVDSSLASAPFVVAAFDVAFADENVKGEVLDIAVLLASAVPPTAPAPPVAIAD
jgi:hypothetical protein